MAHTKHTTHKSGKTSGVAIRTKGASQLCRTGGLLLTVMGGREGSGGSHTNPRGGSSGGKGSPIMGKGGHHETPLGFKAVKDLKKWVKENKEAKNRNDAAR